MTTPRENPVQEMLAEHRISQPKASVKLGMAMSTLNGYVLGYMRTMTLKAARKFSRVSSYPPEEMQRRYNEWRAQLERGSRVCRIYGSEIAFTLDVPERDIMQVCQRIWDHPDEYSDYAPQSAAAYDEFLKFLWVKFPDGRDERVCDQVEM